ncbi:uncharacterized protein J3D65DRAFT_663272 [Phyllosticta citribraziliensis]|uniref:Uncharacterized protein n=1 Tax=Phyllosticta citribraziliensis TaxID=989973 RepID=A0ABR1M7X5_9PEZI
MASNDPIYSRFQSSNSLHETFATALALPVQIAASQDDTEAVEAALHKLWKLVLDTADQTPPTQQTYLVDVIQALKNTKDDGKCCTVWGEQQSWADLPLLGLAMREKWNQSNKSSASWVNINAFAARLTATNTCDFSLYAIWTLRETLEDPEVSKIAVETDSTALHAAAVWLEYAAESLRSLSKEEKAFDGKMAKPGQSLKDKEWRGYCQERWQEWARRLSKVAAEKPDLAPVLDKAVAEVDKR